MKRILSLLLCLFPVVAFCQDKNKPIDLTGNWREIKRMDASKKPIVYSDTIRIRFLNSTEYLWFKANSMGLRGTYKANKTSLDLGMLYFTAEQMTHDHMLLKGEDAYYEFVRYTEAAAKEDNSSASVGDRSRTVEEYNGLKDFSLLKGKWQPYKRTSSITRESIDYTRVIKTIQVPGNKTDKKLGFIYAAKDGEGAPSWYIDKFENSILYCKGRDDRQLKILKCDGKELIFEEDNYTYFCKQF
ncbi:hypothetical protein ACTHGU_15120 [Chitinophagaceae bacterium MMS25-I14]